MSSFFVPLLDRRIFFFFFLNNPAPPEISPLPLPAPLPIPPSSGPSPHPPPSRATRRGRCCPLACKAAMCWLTAPSSGRAPAAMRACGSNGRSEEHTSELQSPCNLVCRLLLEKKNTITDTQH